MILYDMALCNICQVCPSVYKSCTIDSKGEHHSFDDKPAIIYANGNKRWFLNGSFHREERPAIECANGDKWWYQNGQLHRTDGPAVDHVNGFNIWYLNDKRATYIICDHNIVVGKSIEISNNIGVVLRNITGVFYEVLLGSKKVLIAKA